MDDSKEYGVIFPCDYDMGPTKRQEAMDKAIQDAQKTLPTGAIFEIRAKVRPCDMQDQWTGWMAREWGVAWYSGPKDRMIKEPLFHGSVDEAFFDGRFSCVIAARIKV